LDGWSVILDGLKDYHG